MSSPRRATTKSTRKSSLLLTLYLLVLALLFQCEASTSSTLLKRAVQQGSKLGATAATAARGATAATAGAHVAGKGLSKRTAGAFLSRYKKPITSTAHRAFVGTAGTLGNAAAHTVGSTATVTGSAVGRTGFCQFSQRATKLQAQLSKSFSLRAIVSDVITNRPGAPSSSSTSASSSGAAAEDLSQLHHQAQQAQAASTTPMPLSPLLKHTRPTHLIKDLQRIAAGTMSESWSGFVGGYALLMSTDVVRLVYRKVIQKATTQVVSSSFSSVVVPSMANTAATSSSILPYPHLFRTSQHALQLHSRSLAFGIEWAQMSAVFGACRLLVQTVRKGKDDEWNSVLGSTCAGAVFSALPTFTPPPTIANAASQGALVLGKRVIPVTAMARGALLYGSVMFALHPNLWNQGLDTLKSNLQLTSTKSQVMDDSYWQGIE